MNHIEDDLKAAFRRKPAPPGFAAKVFERIESEALKKQSPLSFLRSWAQGIFRKEILAFASAVMLILGVVMQLGGGQSVLADSIERLKVMITVSAGLDRVTSMDCTVLKSGAGRENSQYHVRWSSAGVTRIDMDSSNGTERTLWISKGTVSVADYTGGAVRSTAIATMPSQWQPPMEFLTPTILAQHMEERYGLMQAERQDGTGPDVFLIVGREGWQDIEIAVDAKTYLPKMLKKYALDSGLTNGNRVCLMEVRFHWNQTISDELFVPGPLAGKQ